MFGFDFRLAFRRGDQIMIPPYIGETDWQIPFGGKLLIAKALHRKTGQKEGEIGRRGLKNIFANIRKLLRGNDECFWSVQFVPWCGSSKWIDGQWIAG